MVLKFAGTPTYDRPEMYRELVANITPQVDEFITVAHGDLAESYSTGLVIPFTERLPNLATQWNLILDKAHELAAGEPYYVAVLNDDALVADDWFDRMVEAIERDGSAGASTPRQPGKMHSIFGGAWVVKGGIGVRMSGVTRWWYTDDEIQLQCRKLGGFSVVDGVHAVNRLANQSTRRNDELRAINSEDWPRFKAKYGMPVSPWDNTEYQVVISAPSGGAPQHILDTIPADRPVTVLTEGWETDQLLVAASQFSRFVFLKESVRLFPGFWEAIDSEQGSCWFFARPSCYMGIYDARTLKQMLMKLPATRSKEDSIANEWRIHSTVDWRSIWPDVHDRNGLRMEGDELVIGNKFIEKLKGNARCGNCSTVVGVCDHLRPSLSQPATQTFGVTVATRQH